MGTGFYINGQKYISSKDACVASGYSEDKLFQLCLRKKIKSQQFKGGYFIETRSFLKHIKAKHSLLPIGVLHDTNIWHDSMFKKISGLIVVVIISLFILIVPIFFLQTEHFFNYDITQMSSSYNSVSYFLNEDDPKTMIANINNAAVVVIEGIVNTFYSLF